MWHGAGWRVGRWIAARVHATSAPSDHRKGLARAAGRASVTSWVNVNGARVERAYLLACVAEARRYAWTEARWSRPDDHGHCLICNVALADGAVGFCSGPHWLCGHCHPRFVGVRGEP